MFGRTHRRAPLAGIAAAALCTLALGRFPAHAQEVPDIAGIYEMQGEMTVEGSPDRFVITGRLVVRQDGVNCTTITEAAIRRAAGSSGPVSAALIGTGTAKLNGRKFTGESELQSLVSEVPELDVAVPFAPRTAGPVLDATATGEVLADGSLKLEIRSTLVGEGFTLPEGRRTIVVAKRVARKPTELKKK
jgi:hypothetical protein